jgi:hypothetical protein
MSGMEIIMTPRAQLLHLIETLDEERVEAMLILLRSAAEVTEPEGAEADGGVESDDMFGGMIGMIGDEYDGPTDVSANVHKYVADAIESEWRR